MLVAAAVPGLVRADSVQLRRDDVIPVVMETELSFSGTHAGDVFKAEVADSHMLPLGSRIEGVVNRVVQKEGKRQAFMDIEFTSIILPDGHRASFHGTPIALSKNYVTQDRDGRWQAKKGVSKATVVLGSTAGGLVLGSLIKKPFEGAFIGALIGILAGETDKEDIGDGDIVAPKGSKVGARVDEDLTIQFGGRWDSHGSNDDRFGPYDRDGYNHAGYDRYGYDRDGHYDAQYDSTRNSGNSRDSGESGYDSAGYDKYGFDKKGHYDSTHDTTRNSPSPNRTAPGGGLHIEIGRKAMDYRNDEQPYRNGWIVMVPLKATAAQLGYSVSKDDAEGSYRIESDADVLVVEQDSRDYRLNRNQGTLPRAVQVRDGVAYVPIDVFTLLTKGAVVVNGTKYRPQA
ncbi:MAG: stalk domain-containing protein [Fimbriimonadales bacterium]